MNGSPSSVITMGYGAWGSTGLVLTLGYGIGAAAVIRAGRIEYTVADQRIDWRAEPGIVGYTATGQRIDWRADR
jgi:hypothetical protein